MEEVGGGVGEVEGYLSGGDDVALQITPPGCCSQHLRNKADMR